MKHTNETADKIERAIITIKVKRELACYLPEPKKSFIKLEDWLKDTRYFDEERFLSDEAYLKEMNELWEQYEKETEAYNELLLKVYEFLS